LQEQISVIDLTCYMTVNCGCNVEDKCEKSKYHIRLNYCCFKAHLHTRCGTSDFAERCNLYRRFSISSNCHRRRQRQVLMRGNQLPVSANRRQHGSQIHFCNFHLVKNLKVTDQPLKLEKNKHRFGILRILDMFLCMFD
jgi:hypothetical protein